MYLIVRPCWVLKNKQILHLLNFYLISRRSFSLVYGFAFAGTGLLMKGQVFACSPWGTQATTGSLDKNCRWWNLLKQFSPEGLKSMEGIQMEQEKRLKRNELQRWTVLDLSRHPITYPPVLLMDRSNGNEGVKLNLKKEGIGVGAKDIVLVLALLLINIF